MLHISRRTNARISAIMRTIAFGLWPVGVAVWALATIALPSVPLLYGTGNVWVVHGAAGLVLVAATAALARPHAVLPRLLLLVFGGWMFAGRMWTFAISGIGEQGEVTTWGRVLGTVTHGLLALAHVGLCAAACLMRERHGERHR